MNQRSQEEAGEFILHTNTYTRTHTHKFYLEHRMDVRLVPSTDLRVVDLNTHTTSHTDTKKIKEVKFNANR